MKKLLLSILIPVLVLGGLAGGAYYAISDSTVYPEPESSASLNDLMNQKMLHAFDSTHDSGKIEFSIDQDDFNSILYQAYQSMDDNTKKYLRGIRIEIDKKQYHVKFYCDISFVKTLVDLTCEFNSDDENFYLSIKDAKVGKITFLDDLAFLVLSNTVSDESLNSQFLSSGLHMKAELKNRRFIYSKQDAYADLNSLIQNSTSGDDMISAFSSMLLKENVLKIDSNDALKADISLEDFSTNGSFVDSGNDISPEELDLEKHRAEVIQLLDDEKINDSDVSLSKSVFDFLNCGYSSLSDSQKQMILSLDLESIGYKDDLSKISYQGYRPKDPNIRDYFSLKDGTLKDVSLISENGLFLSEKMMNQYLRSQGIVGYSYVFQDQVKSHHTFHYVALDNAYFNLYEKDEQSHMDLILQISVSGYDTTLILENVKKEDLSYGMTLENQNIYFGTELADEKMESFLYSLIQSYLPSNEFLTFDGNGLFTINFEGYLKEYLDLLSSSMIPMEFALSTSIEGNSVVDPNAGLRLFGKIEAKR